MLCLRNRAGKVVPSQTAEAAFHGKKCEKSANLDFLFTLRTCAIFQKQQPVGFRRGFGEEVLIGEERLAVEIKRREQKILALSLDLTLKFHILWIQMNHGVPSSAKREEKLNIHFLTI